jgi:DNA invertase Pin-like site-specific DNA recombinase
MMRRPRGWVPPPERKEIKLDLEKAEGIRRLYASGKYLQREIAEMFGVSLMTVNDILQGRVWAEKRLRRRETWGRMFRMEERYPVRRRTGGIIERRL